jgi:hypothetical protein
MQVLSRFVTLTIFSALSMFALETVSLADDARDERRREAEEAAMSQTIQWGRLHKNQLYFVFDGSSPECRMDGGGSIALGVIDLTQHGVLLSFLAKPVRSSLILDEERSRAVGLIMTENCMVEVVVRKYVRNLASDWTAVRPLRLQDIGDLDKREKYLAAQNLLPAPRGQLRFLFDTTDSESCPHGFGNLTIRSHSLLGGIDSGFSGLALPAKSGPFERKFELTEESCKYELEVRFYAEVEDGVLVPVRARRLGGDDFQR